MGKKKSAASPSRKSSALKEAYWKLALHGLIGVIFVSTVVLAFRISQLYVDRQLAFPSKPPKVVLINRPAWMTDFLAGEIVKTTQPIGLHSAFNQQLLVDTARSLQDNPWIERVNQIRRVYGKAPGDTLTVDCDYRTPAALIKWGDFFWLVDSQGIKLPEQYDEHLLPKVLTSADGKTNIRIIDGISHAPPEPGRTWPGDDVAAGLEMARLLATVDWADQIRDIDVSNYAGRRDSRKAQIVLVTQFGTQLRWGRAPSEKDAFIEVPVQQKLASLQDIYVRSHRVDDGQPWLDLRFDRVTCPGAAQNATAQIDGHRSEQ
jgi:hypothetical protein